MHFCVQEASNYKINCKDYFLAHSVLIRFNQGRPYTIDKFKAKFNSRKNLKEKKNIKNYVCSVKITYSIILFYIHKCDNNCIVYS